MTSPFSKDYVPKIEMSDVNKESKISRAKSASRRKAMKSDDPAVQKAARGNLGSLSKKGQSPNFKAPKGEKA